MRPRSFALLLVSLTAALATVRDASLAGPPPPMPPGRAAATATETPGSVAAEPTPRADSDPATYSSCTAPSVLRLRAYDDGRDPDVPACSPDDAWARLADAEQSAASRCDQAGRPIDLARVLSGALPLDALTARHVRAVFRDGQLRGRRADRFGVVGDSMSMDRSFLRPFGREPPPLPPAVEQALRLASPGPGRGTVIDLFHNPAPDEPVLATDSFLAPRAAKVGVRAGWALQPRGSAQTSPFEELVAAVSPAYVVVLYGANDALWRTDGLQRLAAEFSASLGALVDAAEARGIIPILTTVPKHLRERGWPDCPATATAGANERFAAQATVLSAAVADLACRRHVPLVDLRWSLDPLLDHGVGPDGVHLSAHLGGGGRLDESGLQCGYNVRNLVTLRELKLVLDVVGAGEW